MASVGSFLPAFLLLLVFAGLMLRLPAPMVLAGGALLGALLGQMLGIYHVVMMGDLARQVGQVLDNETLIAIPLLVLSGTLLGGTGGFAGLRTRLKGPFAPLPDLLLALGGGGGEGRSGLTDLLERIAPSSAFLVLLGGLLDRAFQSANLPEAVIEQAPGHSLALMAAMVIPSLILGATLVVAGIGTKSHVTEQISDRFWPCLAAVFIALIIPALILLNLASPAEAGAVGVGLTLVLKAASKELQLVGLGVSLDHALSRAAIPFAALIAGAVFLLMFEGIGGRETVSFLLSPWSESQGVQALVPVLVGLALLGLLIDPLPLAVLLLPLTGPFLLEHGVAPVLVGMVFALAPLSGVITPGGLRWRVLLPLFQAVLLALAIFWPLDAPLTGAGKHVDMTVPVEKEPEGFTPVDTSDSPQQNSDEERMYAPPNDNE